MRAIFFGTPDLSAEILQYLLDSSVIEIVAVVSNPDTIGGRGHGLLVSPVSALARARGIPLFQPDKVRKNPTFCGEIETLKPDICLVVAYGKILPEELLSIPEYGFLNLHTSLLPLYRGAAPIQYALLNGDPVTGLTVQQMSLGMDEGDVLLQESWDISPDDTTGVLFAKTARRGGPLLTEALRHIQAGTIVPIPQDHDRATYTRYISKTDAELGSSWTLDQAYHAWQAYTPWPGLYGFFGDMKIVLHRVERRSEDVSPYDFTDPSSRMIEWRISEGCPAIKLLDGLLVIRELTPAGKKRMSGEDFIRGFMSQ